MNPFTAANKVKTTKQATIRRGRMAHPEYAAGYMAGYEVGSQRKKMERARAKALAALKVCRHGRRGLCADCLTEK